LTATPQVTGLLAALLRSDDVSSVDWERVNAVAFMEGAARHGVVPLVAERIGRRTEVPDRLRSLLDAEMNRHAAADLVREAELRACLAGLDEAGVAALVMKGAQLAYSHYPRPDLRPRSDTDVLIAAEARDRVDEVLVRLGYTNLEQATGEFLTGQSTYLRHRDAVSVHALDVHWRIANPQPFANFLSFEEAQHDAVPIVGLSDRARGLSDVHALLVACVHRVAHHYDADRLIWLYDIHLIASRLVDAEWAAFAALSERGGVTAVCGRSLERAAQQFGTRIPAFLLEPGTPSHRNREATAAYLKPDRRHVQRVVEDMRALRSWSDRLQLAKEHLLPPASYMRDVYAPSSAAPLPLLYVRRMFRGARKWLTRSA
jgi:hypothetical protein